MAGLHTGPDMIQVARNAFSFVFQGSLHLNLLRGNIPKKNILFPSVDGDGSTAPPKARARGAGIQTHFNFRHRCLASLGFSNMLNPMLTLAGSLLTQSVAVFTLLFSLLFGFRSRARGSHVFKFWTFCFVLGVWTPRIVFHELV